MRFGVFLLAFIMFLSCRSASTAIKPCVRLILPLSSSINSTIKRGDFITNPLIVKNGITLGLLDEFDKEFLDTTHVWTGNMSKVSKGQKYFIDLYGEKAKDGVLFYRTEDYIKDKNAKLIYLLNGIETEYKIIKKLNRRNKIRATYGITEVIINNDEKVNIVNFSRIEDIENRKFEFIN